MYFYSFLHVFNYDYTCLPRCTSVYSYLHMFIYVWSCFSMFKNYLLVFVYLHLQIFSLLVLGYICLTIFTHVYPCLPYGLLLFNYFYVCGLVLVNLCLPKLTRLYLCLLVFTYVYLCLLVLTYVNHCLLILVYLFTHVYLCLTVYLCLSLFFCAFLSTFIHDYSCLPVIRVYLFRCQIICLPMVT